MSNMDLIYELKRILIVIILTIAGCIFFLIYGIYVYHDKKKNKKREEEIQIQISEQIKHPKEILSLSHNNTIICVNEKELVKEKTYLETNETYNTGHTNDIDTNSVDITYNNITNDKYLNEQMYEAEVINENGSYINYVSQPLPDYADHNKDEKVKRSTSVHIYRNNSQEEVEEIPDVISPHVPLDNDFSKFPTYSKSMEKKH